MEPVLREAPINTMRNYGGIELLTCLGLFPVVVYVGKKGVISTLVDDFQHTEHDLASLSDTWRRVYLFSIGSGFVVPDLAAIFTLLI